MISSRVIILFSIFFISCENDGKTKINFPILHINPFVAGDMELESNDVSYILNSSDISPISIRLSWQAINRFDINKINIYKITNTIPELIEEIEDIEKQSITIDHSISYETEEQFQMTVVHESGVESDLSNSNKISLNITQGEPDNYLFTYDTDTLEEIKIEWSNSGNGITNPIINVFSVRNNLLDSISLNVLYKENEEDNFRKIVSVIGHYQSIGLEDSNGQGESRFYNFNIASLKSKVNMDMVELIQKDPVYFSNDSFDNPISSLFKINGQYQVYFYLYKNVEGRKYIYKTTNSETIDFPK